LISFNERTPPYGETINIDASQLATYGAERRKRMSEATGNGNGNKPGVFTSEFWFKAIVYGSVWLPATIAMFMGKLSTEVWLGITSGLGGIFGITQTWSRTKLKGKSPIK
jgi:hypothetical protein